MLKSSDDKTIKIEANLTPRVNIDLQSDDDDKDEKLLTQDFQKAYQQRSGADIKLRNPIVKLESPNKTIKVNQTNTK